MTDSRRAIPSMERLLSSSEMQPILAREPRARVVATLRSIQDYVRNNGAHAHDVSWYVAEIEARLRRIHSSSLRGVINATGVVLHTNLGRAPLSEAALAAMIDAARDYSNLEYDLNEGTRGSRYDHCTRLLCELTGAEAALVVNNNAAALVLALNTFAAGREAIVSRGELVEIGGSFRIPDIMERSGARLREVGATNRTHLQDYSNACTPETAAILKVHRSNFAISGFVSEVSVSEIAESVATQDVVVIHDLGSGLLEEMSDVGLTGEPTAAQAVSTLPNGVVTMSGDKLLGGPQAGILIGPRKYVQAMKANPLCRALRVDKLTLAALEATLRAYAGANARAEIPVLRMLCMPPANIAARATRMADTLTAAGVSAETQTDTSSVGGGAFPAASLPTTLVLLRSGISANALEARLRGCERPIVARIVKDSVAIDLRTVRETDEEYLFHAVIESARE